MQHTPGPWRVFDKPGTLAVMGPAKTDQHNEVVHWSGFDSSHYPDQAKANARLIAAAPEMQRLLSKLVEQVSDPVGVSVRQLSNTLRASRILLAKIEEH